MRKATISFVMSVCLSVCLSVRMEELGSHYKDFHDVWYYRIFFLENLSEKTQISLKSWSTRWRICLRHCAARRKAACSIPDGIIGSFHWHDPSGRTMAVGSTQPLTEMSTRNISWGLRRSVPRADKLTTFVCRFFGNSGNLKLLERWGPVQACNGFAFTFIKIREKYWVLYTKICVHSW